MADFSNEELVDGFLDHVRYLKVAHHVAGRIRVRAILNKVKDLANIDESNLETIVQRIPGINNYRINKKALSVVIEYDSAVLPYDLWEDIGQLNKYPLMADDIRSRLLSVLEN